MRIFIVWGEKRGDEGAISKCVCVCMAKMKKIRRKNLRREREIIIVCFCFSVEKKIKVKWDQCSVESQMGLQQESSNVLVTNTEMETRNRYFEIENQ